MGKLNFRSREGSAMLLALVFLLFCMILGSAVLTSAGVNALRAKQQTDRTRMLSQYSSAMLVLRQQLIPKEGTLRLIVRDVTVRSQDGDRRTVTYEFPEDTSLLLTRLRNCAITAYNQETGLPDIILPETVADSYETDAGDAQTLTLEVDGTELCGNYAVTDGCNLEIFLAPEDSAAVCLILKMQGHSSAETTDITVQNGKTVITKTRVIHWEPPVIEKRDGDG